MLNENFGRSLQLAFGESGVLYGHEYGTGTFFKIDTSNGVIDGTALATADKYTDTASKPLADTTPPSITCKEATNPHGNIIPGKKRGNDKPNLNPDGFYEVCAKDDNGKALIYVTYDGAGDDFVPYGPFESCVIIKFTEAPGAEPSIKKIGSPPNGGATAVKWHITLPADPLIIAVDESGNEATCGSCIVPPRPM